MGGDSGVECCRDCAVGHGAQAASFLPVIRELVAVDSRKPSFCSIGDREPFSQQSLRASNPQLLKICMWWETDMMLERPYQLERAE